MRNGKMTENPDAMKLSDDVLNQVTGGLTLPSCRHNLPSIEALDNFKRQAISLSKQILQPNAGTIISTEKSAPLSREQESED